MTQFYVLFNSISVMLGLLMDVCNRTPVESFAPAVGLEPVTAKSAIQRLA